MTDVGPRAGGPFSRQGRRRPGRARASGGARARGSRARREARARRHRRGRSRRDRWPSSGRPAARPHARASRRRGRGGVRGLRRRGHPGGVRGGPPALQQRRDLARRRPRSSTCVPQDFTAAILSCVNFDGVVNGTRAFLPRILIESGAGLPRQHLQPQRPHGAATPLGLCRLEIRGARFHRDDPRGDARRRPCRPGRGRPSRRSPHQLLPAMLRSPATSGPGRRSSASGRNSA